MSVEYAIIIKNKTRLETLIERFNTKAQAKFYIERSGGDFNDYEKEHEIFHNSLSNVQRNLSTVLKNKIVEEGKPLDSTFKETFIKTHGFFAENLYRFDLEPFCPLSFPFLIKE